MSPIYKPEDAGTGEQILHPWSFKNSWHGFECYISILAFILLYSLEKTYRAKPEMRNSKWRSENTFDSSIYMSKPPKIGWLSTYEITIYISKWYLKEIADYKVRKFLAVKMGLAKW